MPLSFELRVDERDDARVTVDVCLAPLNGTPHPIDGVAFELHDPDGESLGPRLLVPLTGNLDAPRRLRVDLHANGPIPAESRVVATAWWGCKQITASCPSERGTSLEHHVRGAKAISLSNGIVLDSLDGDESDALTRALPWLSKPTCLCARLASESTPAMVADEVAASLGLDEENTKWLRELLADECDGWTDL